jgi:hypothetical protein
MELRLSRKSSQDSAIDAGWAVQWKDGLLAVWFRGLQNGIATVKPPDAPFPDTLTRPRPQWLLVN